MEPTAAELDLSGLDDSVENESVPENENSPISESSSISQTAGTLLRLNALQAKRNAFRGQISASKTKEEKRTKKREASQSTILNSTTSDSDLYVFPI